MSTPSLNPAVPGHIGLHLVCHVRGDDRLTALELALADSIELDTLLATFWPAAEWSFIGEETFKKRFPPFQPGSCVSLIRRVESLAPAEPLVLEQPMPGFCAAAPARRAAPKEISVRHVFPWVPSRDEDLSPLFERLLFLPSPRWIVVRMGTDSETRGQALVRLANTIDICERFLTGAETSEITRSEQAKAIREASLDRYAQLSDGVLRGSVLVFSPGKVDRVTANVLGQCITGDSGRRQVQNILEGGFAFQEIGPELGLGAFQFFESEPFSPEEAACAFRLPCVGGQGDLGLPVARHRTVPFRKPSAAGSAPRVVLGTNLHRGVVRPVDTGIDDLLSHVCLLGATGTGKSTFLLNLALEICQTGCPGPAAPSPPGLALVDPHGDLAEDFIARLPRQRSDDLVVVDFNDRAFPVPLNFLKWATVEERDLIIDTLYSTLRLIYTDPTFFGPVFEQYFRTGLRLLLGDRPSRQNFTPTLLEFPLVLRDHNFRKYLLSHLHDEEIIDAVLEADMVTASSEWSLRNVAPYINSKLARFLTDTQLRRIVGHGNLALNFRELMDSGKIVVFKLAQGRLGASVTDILIAQIVARFRLAAMGRANIPRAQRKPFFLICDEAHAVCDYNIASMLSECRKQSLGLVLATQFAKQLQDRGVLEAVLGNVGTLVSFRVSSADSTLLAPVFQPVIGAQDLTECPNWNGYVRLHSSANPSRAVSFQTLPPNTVSADQQQAQALTDKSRRRWGVPAEEVERQIKSRRAFIRNIGKKGFPDSQCHR